MVAVSSESIVCCIGSVTLESLIFNIKAFRKHSAMSMRRRAKKIEISAPTNFVHRIHAGYDPSTGEYHGLPKVTRLFELITPSFRYLCYRELVSYDFG